MLKGQSLHTKSPFEYVDMSIKEQYDSAWKTQTRTRIKRSDGVIALISASTPKADGELWEITCAREEGKPLMGIWLGEYRTKPTAMALPRAKSGRGQHRRLHQRTLNAMPDLRRALLVGIDQYDNFNRLGGCVNDVHRLQPLLAHHENGDPNFDCVVRDTATRDSLIQDVQACVAPGADLSFSTLQDTALSMERRLALHS